MRSVGRFSAARGSKLDSSSSRPIPASGQALGRKLLANALSGLAGEPEVVLRSPAEAIERGGRPSGSPSSRTCRWRFARKSSGTISTITTATTLDDGLPLLDGKSPRQAARTKKGRQAVVSWLKRMENREARRAAAAGETPCDLTWIWSELGVADLRR